MRNKLQNLIHFFIFCSLNYFLYILSLNMNGNILFNDKKVLFFILVIFLNILLLSLLFLLKQRTSKRVLLNKLEEKKREFEIYKNNFENRLNQELEKSEAKDLIIYEQSKSANFRKREKKEVFDIGFLIDNLIQVERFHNINILYTNSFSLSLYSYKDELFQVLYNIIKNSQKIFNQNEIEEKYIFIEVDSKDENIIINLKSTIGKIEEKLENNFFNPATILQKKSKQTDNTLYITYLIIKNTLKADIKISNTQIEYKNKKYDGVLFSLTLPKT